MAVARALLTAAGFLPSTATERATSVSQSGSIATERATAVSQSGSTATEHATKHENAIENAIEKAIEEDFNLDDEDLEKIVAVLLWMAQDFQPDMKKEDIHAEAVEAVLKQSDCAMALLHRASATKLLQLIDIMFETKEGKAKDPNDTLKFMRRVEAVRWQLLDHMESTGTSRDNATEHVELDEDVVSQCYQQLGRALLTHDLLPHETRDKRYHIRHNSEDDTQLTDFQRLWTDRMLRKSLGDKKVALRIWQNGLPSIAVAGHNVLVVSGSGTRSEVRGPALDMGMLQSSLDECLRWYISLANDIVVHQTQEGFDAQLSSSSMDEQDRQQQQQRREQLQKAQDALRLGATLAKERDAGKRTFFEMNAIEQPILEDYDSGRAKKRCIALQLTELKPFRSQQ